MIYAPVFHLYLQCVTGYPYGCIPYYSLCVGTYLIATAAVLSLLSYAIRTDRILLSIATWACVAYALLGYDCVSSAHGKFVASYSMWILYHSLMKQHGEMLR
jgi:hypothetical protein